LPCIRCKCRNHRHHHYRHRRHHHQQQQHHQGIGLRASSGSTFFNPLTRPSFGVRVPVGSRIITSP
jgi:hypothetical protein